MIRVTVYAGPAVADDDGPYEASTVQHIVAERDLSEWLRNLGLEWRQADYFPGRQTVITFDPIEPDRSNVRAKIREASIALEDTGLL